MTAFRIADRVRERQIGPCTLLQLPVSVPQVVRWCGSFASNPDLGRGDDLIQRVLASLLDKGTRQRDRFALFDEIERRGARISFRSAGVRMEFSGSAMTSDVPDVMALMAEILREPLLDEDEFIKVKGRMQASLEEARDSAIDQANGALCRRLFSQRHPMYTNSVEDDLAALESMSIDAVRSYYEKHVGANGLIVAVTGDIDVADVKKAVRAAFDNWESHCAVPTHATESEPVDPGNERIQMENKPALEVRFGHAIPIARADPEWLPLHIGIYILGGTRLSRLFRYILCELGLTYRLRARLRGMQGDAQGYFETQISLSQENLGRGLKEVRQVIQAFVEEGCTLRELDDAKTMVAGAEQVYLDRTYALASRLHNDRVLGFTVDAVDTYVEEVGDLTLQQVRDSIVRRIQPEDLHTVIAGTLGGDMN